MAKAAPAKKAKASSKAKTNRAKTITEITTSFESLKSNMDDFIQKGTKASGKRARMHAQDIKKLCQLLRGEIQATVNANKK